MRTYDAERLAHDPAIRAVVDRTGLDRQAASTSQMGRFETGWLTSEANVTALAYLSGAWIDRVHARRPQTTIVLDMDSSVSETHGAQEGSTYNGQLRVVMFYNPRGTAEQRIKEGKNAIVWTRLSCRRFAANAVRLQLHALAYNLANFLRTLALPEAVKHWS